MCYTLQSKGIGKFQANYKKLTLCHHLTHSENFVKCTKLCLATCSPERLCWLQDASLFSQLQGRCDRSCNHYTSHTLHRPLLYARRCRNLLKTVSGCFEPPSCTPKHTEVYAEVRIIMYQLKLHEKYSSNSQILTGSGLATPILTVPAGAPFSACTASSRLPFSKLILLTNISRSPGRSLPSCSATPPGTNERITITVFAGSTGS